MSSASWERASYPRSNMQVDHMNIRRPDEIAGGLRGIKSASHPCALWY